MMGQLLSKDVLYEPLKELADNVSFHLIEQFFFSYAYLFIVPWIPRKPTESTRAG